jgi:RNA polymerase sigma-70 factor (ECF subfamily)
MVDVDAFEAHRDHLMAVAYQTLGNRSDAEDAVQEAWLRYAAMDPGTIVDLRAWLTTVTARICLDVLRSARVRREVYAGEWLDRAGYVGPWLPEPVVRPLGPAPADDPADRAVRLDRVSYALLAVLERLRPEERVAMVLHDVFAVPFDEIAQLLEVTPVNARQLASRARRAVSEDGIGHSSDRAEQERVLRAFLAACEQGDIDALVAVLAPDVVAVGDGGGKLPAGRRPVYGALQVARFMAGLFRQSRRMSAVFEPVLVNGDLGLLADAAYPDGPTMRFVMCFAVADGRITGIFDQVNPEKLTRVPAPDPTRSSLA